MFGKNVLFPQLVKPVRFYQHGQLVTEKVEHGLVLAFLYQTWLGSLVRFMLARSWSAKVVGWYQQSSFSRRNISGFVEKHQIDLDACEKSIDQYDSFHDFFIRRLRPEARVVDRSPHALVSPADGKLFVVPSVTDESRFFVKGVTCNLWNFLQDSDLFNRYYGGTLLMFRLAPYDYHRFHFPVDCTAQTPKPIAGRYESVNPLVFMQGIAPLVTNQRLMMPLQIDQNSSVHMIAVGALFVGSIVPTFAVDKKYVRGDEAGYFAFGGSTIVVLCPPDQYIIREEFILNSAQGFETAVQVGQLIGIKNDKK